MSVEKDEDTCGWTNHYVAERDKEMTHLKIKVERLRGLLREGAERAERESRRKRPDVMAMVYWAEEVCAALEETP